MMMNWIHKLCNNIQRTTKAEKNVSVPCLIIFLFCFEKLKMLGIRNSIDEVSFFSSPCALYLPHQRSKWIITWIYSSVSPTHTLDVRHVFNPLIAQNTECEKCFHLWLTLFWVLNETLLINRMFSTLFSYSI